MSNGLTTDHMKMVNHPIFNRPWTKNGNFAAAAFASSQNKGIYGIIAGVITGTVETLITYPTEYIKTQLQLDSRSGVKKYLGMTDCIVKTYKQYGIFGYYRGLTVLLVGAGPKSGVRFGSFTIFKELSTMKDSNGNLTTAGRLLCGLGAGISEAILVMTPMETVKVKFIHDRRQETPRFKGFLSGVGLIIKEEGLQGIYKGVVPTMIKQGSNQAIRWYVVETLKMYYKGDDHKKSIPAYVSGIIGVIAGAASVYGNTPIDVVKTRMQGLEASKYKGTIDCIAKIWREEGPTAFYKGTVPRLGRVCLDVGLSYVIFDFLMKLVDEILIR